VVCPMFMIIEMLAVNLGTLAPGSYSVTAADLRNSFPLTVSPSVPTASSLSPSAATAGTE
jgi:hypothetical protein